jgi:ribosome-binding ATPase YchF (GTP1/OBG family)
LFQLMTSAKDSPRGHGRLRPSWRFQSPRPRLDRLSAIFNPRKHVPATIEFTDVVAPGRTGAAALIDLAGYKTADALVHVVRAFADEAVPHPSGSVDPARDAQAMEDELILAIWASPSAGSNASTRI